MKLKCPQCNLLATWYYMPCCETPGYYCDNHVPRGCSCNFIIGEDCNPILGEDGHYIEETDDQGRLLPCCEWDYCPYGISDYDYDNDADYELQPECNCDSIDQRQ